ncbi:UNVERIFIED_CONTAM: LemA family protein [Campylobacter lari]
MQHNASTVDNYLEQRVVILENTAALVSKAIDFDKSTMTEIAALRSGSLRNHENDSERNAVSNKLDSLFGNINVQLERYPELRAHDAINKAMQENSYLQKEITAARELYNDTVYQ